MVFQRQHSSMKVHMSITVQSTNTDYFLHTGPIMLKVKQEAVNTKFKVLGMTRPGIEPTFTASVVDAPTT